MYVDFSTPGRGQVIPASEMDHRPQVGDLIRSGMQVYQVMDTPPISRQGSVSMGGGPRPVWITEFFVQDITADVRGPAVADAVGEVAGG